MLNQAVIFCGGRGTRLKNNTITKPKPMVIVKKKPFLYHLILQLKKQGIKNFFLLTGYKSKIIKSYFGDGSKFDINIEYSWSPTSWETSKRLIKVKKKLHDNFLICYSDNYINFNLKKHLTKFKKSDLTLTLIKKKHGNIEINNKKYKYNDGRKDQNFKFVELGYILIRKKIINSINAKKNKSISFYFNKIFEKYKISSFKVDHYHSISDPRRLRLTRNYFLEKKILLLDRDGTINQKVRRGRYVTQISKFRFIKKTLNLLKILSKKNFSFIIITNQAGVGRGIMSINDLKSINNYMVNKLKKEGIKILKIYSCNHHWKDNCKCRKPKPYMIEKSVEEFNLNLKKTIFIGDDIRDWKTAKTARCNYLHKNRLLNIKDRLYLGDISQTTKAIKIIERTYT